MKTKNPYDAGNKMFFAGLIVIAIFLAYVAGIDYAQRESAKQYEAKHGKR